jgi:hypothetical protein
MKNDIMKFRNQKHSIYSVPCECRRKCIGDTRPLNTRTSEHKSKAIMAEISKQKMAEYFWDKSHRIEWDKAGIINKNKRKRDH